METKVNQFKTYGDRDINVYYNWLMDKTKNDETHRYEVLANCNEYSVYDILQMKMDCDGDFTQQFIELKGRYINFTDYPESAVDYSKINKLQRLTIMTGVPTFMCAIYYPSKKLCFWQIDPEKVYEAVEMECQESKADPNRQGKVKKKMVLLPLSEAKVYNI